MGRHSTGFSVTLSLPHTRPQAVTTHSETKFHTNATQHAVFCLILAFTDKRQEDTSSAVNGSKHSHLLTRFYVLTPLSIEPAQSQFIPDVYNFLATDQTTVSSNGMSTEYVKESVVAYFIFCNCLWRWKLTTTDLNQDSRFPCQVLNTPNTKRQFGLN
jgi:hypothetical protein